MITLADEGFTDFEVANLRSNARSSRQDNVLFGSASVREREGDPFGRNPQRSPILIYRWNRAGVCPTQVTSKVESCNHPKKYCSFTPAGCSRGELS